MTRRPANPWDELRRRRGDDTAPATRPGERAREAVGDFLPPGGSDRLWTATAGVLSAVRALIEVAEDLCVEKGRGSPVTPPVGTRPVRSDTSSPEGFRRVAFIGDKVEEGSE